MTWQEHTVKEDTADISGNIHKKQNRTIGWNYINMAIWLISNASSKPTCLVSFKTKLYEERVLFYFHFI